MMSVPHKNIAYITTSPSPPCCIQLTVQPRVWASIGKDVGDDVPSLQQRDSGGRLRRPICSGIRYTVF
ncbi:hypothetical protein TNCV_3069051 [Trichonephila clavipes]|nr:hypothetical protein TNCV_3069051 [Trichonephila clavipes]